MRLRGLFVCALAGTLTLSACTRSNEEPTVSPDGPGLAAAVQVDAVVGHLEELERIAGEHDGNRAAGTPGYDASVDYVVGELNNRGFDVSTPEFEFDKFRTETERLQVGDRAVQVGALVYSASTGAGGVTARLVAVPGADTDDTPGCELTDYEGLDVTGAIVLVARGGCPFAAKQQVAADRGAAAVLVANNQEGALTGGTLGGKEAARIPTGGISKEDGAALAQFTGDVTLTLDTSTASTRSRSVVAQTKTGSTENVVVVGAHLDSVAAGPGINDDGSGVAAVLETARQLGSAPKVTNAVRFAFWGAEELGLVGSTRYVEGLSDQEREDIALYLNFDMLGSHNAGYLTYDGDDSDHVGAGPGPRGSDGIERTFNAYLARRGIAADGTDFDGRSDYGPFIEHRIPSGGVFSGAEARKTAAQAAKWGGTAEAPYDQFYHSADDTLANVDREALAVNAAAVAYGVGTYAQSIEGPDGVPTGAERVAAR